MCVLNGKRNMIVDIVLGCLFKSWLEKQAEIMCVFSFFFFKSSWCTWKSEKLRQMGCIWALPQLEKNYVAKVIPLLLLFFHCMIKVE